MYEILNDIDVVQRINIQQLRWLSHAFVWRRMPRRDGYLMRGSAEVGEEDDQIIEDQIIDWCNQLA